MKENACLKCKIIPCTNFYEKGKAPLEGGEIYVLNKLIEERIVLPCNVIDVVYISCKLFDLLNDKIFGSDNLPSTKIFPQGIRDLRASAYLLLSCHYRSAIQLLRPIVENCLVSMYWDSKYVLAVKEHKEKQFKKEFQLFEEGQFEISDEERKEVFPNETKQKKRLDYDYCLTWLMTHKGEKNKEEIPISFDNRDQLTKKWGELNRYIHSNAAQYENTKVCCFVKYEKLVFENCMMLYQDVAALMLELLYNYVQVYFPRKTKAAIQVIQETTGDLANQKELEGDINTRLIFSNQLETFFKKPEFHING
jgi:hypothetical protein